MVSGGHGSGGDGGVAGSEIRVRSGLRLGGELRGARLGGRVLAIIRRMFAIRVVVILVIVVVGLDGHFPRAVGVMGGRRGVRGVLDGGLAMRDGGGCASGGLHDRSAGVVLRKRGCGLAMRGYGGVKGDIIA